MRIVSLVPSTTETLMEWGVIPAGRTSFCIEPKGRVENVPVVGGTKTPIISRIVALQPDLVIANQEENRKEDVERLRAAGLNVWVNFPTTVAQSLDYLDELAERTDRKRESQPSIEELRIKVERFEMAQFSTASVVALIWKDPWMGVGQPSYTHDLMRLAGGKNLAARSEGRYPALSEEVIVGLAPEVLLLPSEPYPFSAADRNAWREKLGERTRVEIFNGEDLFWFGLRLARALESLRVAFQPVLEQRSQV